MKAVWIILVIVVLLLGWALLRLEHALIYHPTPLTGATPAAWGVPYEAVHIPSGDGVRLEAWWCPRPEPDAPLLLFFHGNAGNREDRLHNLTGLWQAGLAVLIFDYRGYGGSTGSPSEQGLLADGLAAFDWLRERTGGRPVVLFGRSLGGAVAAAVALQRPAAGLVLESTFTSAREMARRVLPLPGIQHAVRARYDALAAVRTLRMPLLVIHGAADELVPFEMGRRLFEAAASPRKQFRAVTGGHHNDTYVAAGPDYFSWIFEFARTPEQG